MVAAGASSHAAMLVLVLVLLCSTLVVAAGLDLPSRLYWAQSQAAAILRRQHDDLVGQAHQLDASDAQQQRHAAEAQAARKQALDAQQHAHDMQHLVLMHWLRAQHHSSSLLQQPPATPPNSTQPDTALASALPPPPPDGSNGSAASPPPPAASQAPHICVVVRTYAAHGPTYGPGGQQLQPGPLRQLIESVRSSGHQAWQVQLVVVDDRPLNRVERMLVELNDSRVTLHPSRIQMAARTESGHWAPLYHHALYSATDLAIQDCAPHTRWLVVTNGDNAYDPAFWSEVAAGPEHVHVLAFDFYSRNQRFTGRQCLRFAEAAGAMPCKANLLRFLHMDLGSVALDWRYWMYERRSFATMTLTDWERKQGHHDALMVQALMQGGWQPHWVGPGRRCLVAHSPNPQLCAMQGGVWDDRMKDFSPHPHFGCITQEEADSEAASAPYAHMVAVALVHDHDSFQPSTETGLNGSQGVWPMLQSWPPRSTYAIRCLRHSAEVPTVQHWGQEFVDKAADLADLDSAALALARAQLLALLKLTHLPGEEEGEGAPASDRQPTRSTWEEGQQRREQHAEQSGTQASGGSSVGQVLEHEQGTGSGVAREGAGGQGEGQGLEGAGMKHKDEL